MTYNVLEERNKWKYQLEEGTFDLSQLYWLNEYKANREEEAGRTDFRMNRQIEMMCEYIMWLEKRIEDVRFNGDAV